MTRSRLHRMATTLVVIFSVAVMTAAIVLRADRPEAEPEHGVIGVADAHLAPEFWVGRLDHADRVVLAREDIERRNSELLNVDDSMYDLHALPGSLPGKQVAKWIGDLAGAPAPPLFDVTGTPVSDERLDEVAANRNLEAIPERQTMRFGLVARRAALRTFPSSLRVFREPGNTDIDRFQESALFPGTPVAIAHESLDGRWWFVVSPRYAAWIEKQYVAEGARQQVLEYPEKAPYRIVTGATVDTVFTPEQPALSQLQLDMGIRVPVIGNWPADTPVNGQHPYNAHVIELPVRAPDGALQLRPALLQTRMDTAGDYLPLTYENIIRQGFKFLGERYGWGHSYNGRDCSGFVSEVYRSMGVLMPRNTSDQSVSPALRKQLFNESDDAETRMSAIRSLKVGDLVYIPGHVMLVIGRVDGEPWVIHDTTGISYREPEGGMVRVPLNAVSVTPLMPLQFNETQRYVDRMTSIVRVAADSSEVASGPL